jgi:hypothetical protein
MSGTLYSYSHTEVSLVYFSTFEPINLIPDSIIQRAGVPILTRPATSACPASTSALSLTCWGAPPSFSVSSAATITPRFHTASRTISILIALPLLFYRHAAGPGQRQQALSGEHLDVALLSGHPQDGLRIRSERISENRTRVVETRKLHSY